MQPEASKQGISGHSKVRQSKTKQSRAKHGKAKQSRAKPSQTKQSKAMHAKKSKAKPSQAKQSKEANEEGSKQERKHESKKAGNQESGLFQQATKQAGNKTSIQDSLGAAHLSTCTSNCLQTRLSVSRASFFFASLEPKKMLCDELVPKNKKHTAPRGCKS